MNSLIGTLAFSNDAQPLVPADRLRQPLNSNVIRMRIGRFDFTLVCNIEPQRNADGSIKEFMPQSRYKNADSVPLNRYGNGPFCKFKIPNNFMVSGVYALMSGKEVKYIGESQSLSPRYNMGYGTISPRNCFVGGQETNCRLNNLIFLDACNSASLSLWFLPTDNYKAVEAELLGIDRPVWNRK